MENIGPITTLLKYDIQKMKEDAKLINIPTSVNRIEFEIMETLVRDHCIEIVVAKRIGDILMKRFEGRSFVLDNINGPLFDVYMTEKKIHNDINGFVKLKAYDSRLEEALLIPSDYEVVDYILSQSKKKYFNKIKIDETRYNRLKKYLYYKYDIEINVIKNLRKRKCLIEVL